MCRRSKIQSIVCLRQTLRRWRSRAAARAVAAAPEDVPPGHVAVCVGGASRRYVVRTSYLNHPAFRQLLRQAEEEYGFPSGAAAGPIALPCDVELFEHVLRHVSSSPSSRFADLEALQSGTVSFCCAGGGGFGWRGESIPLLRGIATEKLVW